jgi:hypothetical protein
MLHIEEKGHQISDQGCPVMRGVGDPVDVYRPLWFLQVTMRGICQCESEQLKQHARIALKHCSQHSAHAGAVALAMYVLRKLARWSHGPEVAIATC